MSTSASLAPGNFLHRNAQRTITWDLGNRAHEENSDEDPLMRETEA